MTSTRLRKLLQQTIFTLAMGSVAILALAAPGTAHSSAPPRAEDPAAAATVAALVGSDPASALTHLPPSFATTMGYRPIVEQMADGRFPANPSGSCSSPVPLPARFEPLCRTHDLGYDLLRYADRSGHPLGGWARTALDSMLIDRMTVSCTDPTCTASASVAQAALGLNTWRQHDGAPASGETTFDIVVGLGQRGIESLLGQR
ncbi:hypothetical protein [Gordonia effusa]|uniref:hypothetical protein n=1 Tax=Gordonia effusa TaxID=263908 RepID=UPI001FDEDF1E|nr:hypothetical protein [Gordonia effusa]